MALVDNHIPSSAIALNASLLSVIKECEHLLHGARGGGLAPFEWYDVALVSEYN